MSEREPVNGEAWRQWKKTPAWQLEDEHRNVVDPLAILETLRALAAERDGLRRKVEDISREAAALVCAEWCEEHSAEVSAVPFGEFRELMQREPCPHCLKRENERLREAAARILAKCAQYQNAPRLCVEEQHAVLEFIERAALRGGEVNE